MGSLISYSGISTKVKAMERFRIRPEQFEAMADLGSVPEAVQFLRSNPSYEKAFSKASEDELHRGKIEQLLNLSKYPCYSNRADAARLPGRSSVRPSAYHTLSKPRRSP